MAACGGNMRVAPITSGITPYGLAWLLVPVSDWIWLDGSLAAPAPILGVGGGISASASAAIMAPPTITVVADKPATSAQLAPAAAPKVNTVATIATMVRIHLRALPPCGQNSTCRRWPAFGRTFAQIERGTSTPPMVTRKL